MGLKYFFFLDFFSAWYFECRRAAAKIALKENVDCVFTTSPPNSVHLFGHYLKKTLKIPWIMDIRDAMTVDPNRQMSVGVRLQMIMENLYEKKFYAAADAIISVSDPIIESIRERHAYLDLASRTHTISNGFDEDDFNGLKKKTPSSRLFTVTYTGSFMGKQTPEYFLKAVQALIDSGSVKASDILIRFIGYFDQNTQYIFDQFSKTIPVEILKFKPYAEALSHQVNSNLLLLIVNIEEHEGGDQTMTGKFFEYIGAQRPIFALVPKGPLKKTIVQGKFGTTAPPKDIHAIAEAFKTVYDQWKVHGYVKFNPDPVIRGQFSRRNLTEALAGIINRLFSEPLT
jgi:glycosyltransferase involved in cell wall biosynthesis